jgi:Fic family protein
MDDLFRYVQQSSAEHPFIKSTVFHYEVEFIHPFSDGNGRMGRLWQTLMLARFNPLFAHIPVESIIKERQPAYYAALAASDAAGQCTAFIDFMIEALRQAISDFYKQFRTPAASAGTRLDAARLHFKTAPFQRQDYMDLFKSLSPATASRDLRTGFDRGMLLKTGDKRMTVYRFKK